MGQKIYIIRRENIWIQSILISLPQFLHTKLQNNSKKSYSQISDLYGMNGVDKRFYLAWLNKNL